MAPVQLSMLYRSRLVGLAIRLSGGNVRSVIGGLMPDIWSVALLDVASLENVTKSLFAQYSS